MSDPAAVRQRLRSHALGLPEAWEDHPWGETVVKVGKKVFAFLGTDGSAEPGVWLKLTVSQPLALAQPGVEPATYGLGKSGWVSVKISAETPFEMLREWLEESYRAVAPKRLARQLDGG